VTRSHEEGAEVYSNHPKVTCLNLKHKVIVQTTCID